MTDLTRTEPAVLAGAAAALVNAALAVLLSFVTLDSAQDDALRTFAAAATALVAAAWTRQHVTPTTRRRR